MTWWLTELVTNNAAAALIFPIAIGLADAMGANSMAFIMAVAFGASASFISRMVIRQIDGIQCWQISACRFY
ncbi:sulfate permease [Vibrio variabilis]|uniref:Sulfate permease n=1 Tax=Vibrio variabilis TaxID=990271 RepID=A0ABQ0J601_9VIBR|nr:sulfate permease [Vibrio variabilis]